MVTPPWEEPLPSCLIGGFHSPAQTKSALRTVLDSHLSHGSQTQPVVDPGRQSQNATSFAPYFEMLLPADQGARLLVIGNALSRYRSVRISQVPSVASLRWSSLIFPNVQSSYGLR